MGETESIDRQLDERHRKAADDHSQNVEHTVTVPVDNRNVFSATTLMWALVVSVGMAAIALGVAIMAEREAQNAEREARVALNHSEELKVQAEVNKILIQTYILKESK